MPHKEVLVSLDLSDALDVIDRQETMIANLQKDNDQLADLNGISWKEIMKLEDKNAALKAELMEIKAGHFWTEGELHQTPCHWGILCPYCQINKLKAEIQRLSRLNLNDLFPEEIVWREDEIDKLKVEIAELKDSNDYLRSVADSENNAAKEWKDRAMEISRGNCELQKQITALKANVERSRKLAAHELAKNFQYEAEKTDG